MIGSHGPEMLVMGLVDLCIRRRIAQMHHRDLAVQRDAIDHVLHAGPVGPAGMGHIDGLDDQRPRVLRRGDDKSHGFHNEGQRHNAFGHAVFPVPLGLHHRARLCGGNQHDGRVTAHIANHLLGVEMIVVDVTDKDDIDTFELILTRHQSALDTPRDRLDAVEMDIKRVKQDPGLACCHQHGFIGQEVGCRIIACDRVDQGRTEKRSRQGWAVYHQSSPPGTRGEHDQSPCSWQSVQGSRAYN